MTAIECLEKIRGILKELNEQPTDESQGLLVYVAARDYKTDEAETSMLAQGRPEFIGAGFRTFCDEIIKEAPAAMSLMAIAMLGDLGDELRKALPNVDTSKNKKTAPLQQ